MTLEDLGKEIREQREKAGLSIDDVASRIKVSARTLQAIENGTVDSLPHTVYAKGFVRSFAMVVGFDMDDLSARLEDVFPQNPLDNPKHDVGPLMRSAPTQGLGKKILLIFILLTLLACIGFGVWYLVSAYGGTLWEFVKQPFSAITTPLPAELQGDVVGTTMHSQDPSGIVAGLLSPTGAQEAASAASSIQGIRTELEQEQVVVQPASHTLELQEEPIAPIMALQEHKQFVFVKANQECWIGARADGASTLEYLTLRPGHIWIFSFKDSLEMKLGNAGGVILQHNGKDMGKIGSPREVKTVRF